MKKYLVFSFACHFACKFDFGKCVCLCVCFLHGIPPCSYPAGFVYLYLVLYYVTSLGSNVRLAQYLFVGFYLINLGLVFRLYNAAKKVPVLMNKPFKIVQAITCRSQCDLTAISISNRIAYDTLCKFVS